MAEKIVKAIIAKVKTISRIVRTFRATEAIFFALLFIITPDRSCYAPLR